MIRAIAAIAAVFLAANAWAADAPPAPVAPPAPAKPFVYTPKPEDIVMGQKDAPVTVVEYASLSCPHCAHFYMNVLPQLTKKYIDPGKVRFVYRHFPLNDPALKGAELVQCADKDRRETFLKVLFQTQDKWAFDANYKDSLAGTAALGGMDRATFDACMNNAALATAIGATAKEAEDVYKVSATPTFFVGSEEEKGDHDLASMSRMIDAALASAKK